MSNSVGRVVAIGAVVLAIPAACVGAVALYGRALAESDVAIGTIVTPEEARARMEAAHARFRAMTLKAAPGRGAPGADRAMTRRRAGRRLGVEHHTSAIPEGTPERAAVPALLAEVRRRQGNLMGAAARALSAHLSSHSDAASQDERSKQRMRTELAADIDQLSPRGLGCVHVADERSTSLRFDTGTCDQQMIESIARPESLGGLRAFGFRRVRCANGRGVMGSVGRRGRAIPRPEGHGTPRKGPAARNLDVRSS